MATSAIQIPSFKTPATTGALSTLLQRLVAFHRRRVTRRQLESLSLEQLRDVGIDPDVVSRGHQVPGDPWMMSRLMSLR